MFRSLELNVKSINKSNAIIRFSLGTHVTEGKIPIRCPKEKDGGIKHEFNKNGHGTSVKGNPQMFYCKVCGKIFYAHTSKFFEKLKKEIKKLIKDLMKGGRMDI